MVHQKNMRPKSPDVVWAFRFQSAFAARMAYRRYLKLKILEIALRTPFAAQVGLLEPSGAAFCILFPDNLAVFTLFSIE